MQNQAQNNNNKISRTKTHNAMKLKEEILWAL
jgi:hypothetical protein